MRPTLQEIVTYEWVEKIEMAVQMDITLDSHYSNERYAYFEVELYNEARVPIKKEQFHIIGEDYAYLMSDAPDFDPSKKEGRYDREHLWHFYEMFKKR